MSDSKAERNPIDQLAEQFAERLRRGEHPALTEYVRQYPELADEIRELFPALVMMEQLKPTSLDAAGDTGWRRERLGDYHLLREVGRGGMGVVYEAEQVSLGRHVALKVFPTDSRSNPTYLERFRREAKAAARLHHTNIVPVFGVGEGEGVHYYAMQFIHGESLDRVLQDVRRLRAGQRAREGRDGTEDAGASQSVAANLLSGCFESPALEGAIGASMGESPPPLTSGTLSGIESKAEYCRSVARIGLQVAEGLAYAHKQGILHRDIKPSNLLLDLQGTVWVTDFGLAKGEDAEELTETGDIIGTIRYMAPERFEGTSLPQSDVYALGMTLYEILTLQPAFGDSNRAQLIQRILHEEPPAPRKLDPRIPRDLETVVLKAIAHDSSHRYATAADFAEDLRRFLADRPIRARRSRLPERLWRWCRRNPAVASLIAVIALLLLFVAIGSSLSAWSLRAAERNAREKLWRSKLNEARATVLSRNPGQRFTSLKRIREALAIARELGLTEEDRLQLRNAAIAALALADFEIVTEGDGSSAGSIDFWPQHYACVEKNGRISVRRIRDDREIAALPQMNRLVSLCPSPDGRHLAVCPNMDQENGQLQLWRLDQPEPCCIHEGTSLSSQYVDFSPDGARLVYESASYLTVVELATGQSQSWPLPGIPRIGGVRCRPGGRDVAVARSVNGKGVLEVRELATGAIRVKLWHDGACTSHDWHPGGRLLAMASEIPKSVISLWDVETGRQIYTSEGHKHLGVGLRFNRVGDRLFSTDWAGTLRLWDVASGRQLQGLLSGMAMPLAFSTDEQYLAGKTVVDGESKIQFVRFAAGREVRTLARFSTKGASQYHLPTFSEDGRLLALRVTDLRTHSSQGLSVLHWPSGRELVHLPLGDQSPLGFDRYGTLWTGRDSSNVFRWPRSIDPATGAIRLGPPEPVISVPDAKARVRSLDGRVLVLCNGYQGALILYGGPSGRLFPTSRQEDVRYAAISPDGKWVASGSHWGGRGSPAKVWDARSGRLVKEFALTTPCDVGFSPDGHWFITDSNGSIRLWRSGTWEEELRVPSDGDARGGTFSPDSRLFILGGYGRVRLVRPSSGEEVARLALAEQTFFSPTGFAPGGELLVDGEDTEAIHVWDLPMIRRQLAEMGLDWADFPPSDGPSLSLSVQPAAESNFAPLPTVEFVGANLVTNPREMQQYQLSLAALALRVNPFDAYAHRRIGQLLEDANPTEAFARYSTALAFEPDQPIVREQRAGVAFRLKRWPQVVVDTSRILEEYADRRSALNYRALAYQHLGRHADAAADLTKMIALTPNAGRLYELRADNYAALGDKARAEADRRKAIEVAPEDTRLLNNMAWRLLTGPIAERDAVAGLRMARRAVELVPNEAALLNTLGIAQYRNDLWKEAVATLNKSLALGNGKADAYDLFFLAMCHQKLGEPTKARKCFDQAVRWVREQKDLDQLSIEELKMFRAEAQACLESASSRKQP